ncbi:MAG: cysteine--tRNA ligase [Firmicutes bacterium]|uniref:Cysteine--tRNA ligase n=1 Tax=Candidatus Gallilactobacillus intestinavium TaxID=2840838 RepID=A0A9D9E7W1_9LACO|nr:cysteine--tRNA ligase [Candidatus Gallilactobacillus intestinavium]
MLKVFNSLTRRKEIFKPLNDGIVNMYVCGPTVYNYIHIGNARSIVAFDTIRRYLEYRGYKVNYVSNFTDVDDKMIKAANENNITVKELADKYINCFKEDISKLNIRPALYNPKATENIDTIIKFIKNLITKEYAYEVNGNVFYRTKKFNDYTKLVHENISDLVTGASNRVSSSELNLKEDPSDFVLWKAAKDNEISWDSPWGAGRPGWHIECSAMINKYLGDTIDIHGGGEDLIFPHHTNEIAQSEVYTGKPLAKYWLHNGFVTVNDEKMSKSLGNFVTLHKLLETENGQSVRFFMSITQYRRPMQYTRTALEDAKNNLRRLENTYNNLIYRINCEDNCDDDRLFNQKIDNCVSDFINAMDDDFNVQNGIASVYDLSRLINVYLDNSSVAKESLKYAKKQLSSLLNIFGIELKSSGINDNRIEQLIKKRDEARKNKNYELSDKIRNQLLTEGVVLEDTPQGTRWRKK